MPIKAGSKIIEQPTPNNDIMMPAKNPEIKQLHIFFDVILSVYFKNTKPNFSFSLSFS
jgi:hypothetical protein